MQVKQFQNNDSRYDGIYTINNHFYGNNDIVIIS